MNIYQHKHTGNKYLLISKKHQFQHNNEWIDGYLYKPLYENDYEYFSKTPEEFNADFEAINQFTDNVWVDRKYWKIITNAIQKPSTLINITKHKVNGTWLNNAFAGEFLCLGHGYPTWNMGIYSKCIFDSNVDYIVYVMKNEDVIYIKEAQ